MGYKATPKKRSAWKPRYERPTAGGHVEWKSSSERTAAVFPPLRPPTVKIANRQIPNIAWSFLMLRAGGWLFIPTVLIMLPFLLIDSSPLWLLLVPWMILNIAFAEREYHKQVWRSHSRFLHALYQRTAELELWHEVWDKLVADNADFAMAEQAADEAVRKSRVSGAAIVVPKGTTVIGGTYTDMVKENLEAATTWRCTKCDGMGYIRTYSDTGVHVVCSKCDHEVYRTDVGKRVHEVLKRNEETLARQKAQRQLTAQRAKLLWEKKMIDDGYKHPVTYSE